MTVLVDGGELGEADHGIAEAEFDLGVEDGAPVGNGEFTWVDVPDEEGVAFLAVGGEAGVATEDAQDAIRHEVSGAGAISGGGRRPPGAWTGFSSAVKGSEVRIQALHSPQDFGLYLWPRARMERIHSSPTRLIAPSVKRPSPGFDLTMGPVRTHS